MQGQDYFTKDDTTTVKFLAIILMFIHHLFAFPDRISHVAYMSMYVSSKNIPIEYEVGVFGKICVATFMVLSGYGTFISYTNCNSSPLSLACHKITKLYRVFWKVFIVFIPLGVILNSPSIRISFETLLYNFFGIQISYNGEWWFLTPYIGILIVLPILIKMICGGWIHSLISILLMLFLPRLYKDLLPLVLPISAYTAFTQSVIGNIFEMTISLLPQFIMGALIAKHELYDKYLRIFSNRFLSCMISFFIVLGTYFIRKITYLYVGLDFLLAPLFIIASASLLRNVKSIRRLFICLGSRSTEMWLIHSFFCYQFCQRLVFSPFYSPLILIWLIIMSFGSSVLIHAFFTFIWKAFKGIGRSEKRIGV